MNSKVSIILPVYNGAKYIRQSMDSCLSQTFTDFELIIVDDCSTDGTAAIIHSYQDSRIRYVRNETNQRLPRSLNIGFARASGNYLTWTSDDNFYMPEALEKMHQCLKANNGHFVYADILAVLGDDVEEAAYEPLGDSHELNKHNCIRACFLYSRKVHEKVGLYDQDMELIEDYDYWVRVAKHFQMLHIKEPLYYYRYHPRQLYTSRWNEIRITEFLFKVKYDFLSTDKVNWFIRDGVSNRIVSRFVHKPRIQKILDRYKAGDLSFTQARTMIHGLLNGSSRSGRHQEVVAP